MTKAILVLLISYQVAAQNPIQRFRSFDDKTKHMTTSTAIAIPATIIAWKITNNHALASLIGFLATLTIGAGKELVWDKGMHRGTPSWPDMGFNAMGAAYGTVAGTMSIGVARHIKDVQEEKFLNLQTPSVFIPDSLITDTIVITNLNN